MKSIEIDVAVDSTDICERLVGITPVYLNNRLQRGHFGLKASIQSGQVRAKHRRFSREDVFGIALVWLLFEAGLRTDPIIRVLKDIAQIKAANAKVAAKKLLDSKADWLVIRRVPRKPTKHPTEKPDQTVHSVRRSQLAELIQEHSDEEILAIPVGAKFSDIASRLALLY